MKILIIGMNRDFNAEFFYRKAFERLGHEVTLLDEYEGVEKPFLTRILHTRTKIFNFTLKNLPVNRRLSENIKKIDPDHIILFKGELLSDEVLKNISESYNLYLYYPDTYRFKPILKNRLEYFRIVFTAANKIEFYKKLGARKVLTVPWACDPEFHRKMNIDKIYNITFIGTWYPNRGKKLRKIEDVIIFGNFWPKRKNIFPGVYGENYIRVINQTRINLNLHHPADVKADAPNMRTFEISGCNAFQITDFIPSIKQYFPSMPVFKNIDELKELIKYYFNNEYEMNNIAEQNQKICYKKFKYTDSASKIINSF